ncbi:MAG: tetratricopeptide repeat protein [Bryobacterales bacterium]|nr:tetratricopeptide repeat protein [Bryobacterales bacterium]
MKRKIAFLICVAGILAFGAFWLSVMGRSPKGNSKPSAPAASPAAANAHEQAMLTEQLKLKPDHAPVLLRLAELEQEAGRPAQAAGHLRTLLKSEPGNREALLELGRVLHDSGDVPGALRETRRLLELDPNNVDAHYNLGAIHANQGEIEAARRAWTEAVRIGPATESGKRAAAGLRQLAGMSSALVVPAAAARPSK